jgi:PAS domain S-box-containing protein
MTSENGDRDKAGHLVRGQGEAEGVRPKTPPSSPAQDAAGVPGMAGALPDSDSLPFAFRLLETTPVLTYVYDLQELSLVYCNSRVFDVLGYSGAELRAKGSRLFADLLHPDDFIQLAAHHARVASAEDGHLLDLDCRLRHAKGHWIVLRCRQTAFDRDAQGRLTQMIGTAEDVTEQRRTEDVQRRLRDDLAATVTAIPDLRFEVDRDGRILDYGAAGPGMLRLSPDAFLGRRAREVLPADAAAVVSQAIDEAVLNGWSSGSVYSLSVRGETRWYELSIAAKGDRRGPDARFVVLARDITRRRKLEVEQAELESQRLRVLKAESLGRMAGAIAHHFNNLLGAVMGNLELAMDVLPKGSVGEADLAEAMGAARRAADVSAMMLAYLGQESPRTAPLDLSETCRRMLPGLRAAMPKNAELKADFPGAGPVIEANSHQIQKVLSNLTTNAWEALGGAPGAVRVSARTVSREDIPETRRDRKSVV